MRKFTKVYSSLLMSSVWREPDHVRLVWITMLAACDRQGRVEASVPGLADAARVSIDNCLDALQRLQSPDKWSRSKEHEGRRIAEIDGGWLVLNRQKYWELRDDDDRRAYQAEWVKKKRAAKKSVDNVDQCLPAATNTRPIKELDLDLDNTPPVVPLTGDRPTKKKSSSQKTRLPDDWAPSLQHAELAAKLGVTCLAEEEKFRDHAAATGRRMADWDAAFRTWLRKAVEMSGGNRGLSSELIHSEARRIEANTKAMKRDWAREQRSQREVPEKLSGPELMQLATAALAKVGG